MPATAGGAPNKSQRAPPRSRCTTAARSIADHLMILRTRAAIPPRRLTVQDPGLSSPRMRVQLPSRRPLSFAVEAKLAEAPACRAGDSGGSTRRSRHGDVAQFSRAPALQAGRCRCDSDRLHHFRADRSTAGRFSYKEVISVQFRVCPPLQESAGCGSEAARPGRRRRST